MGTILSSYVASFQTEPFYAGKRYHWMICRADNADQLVSWGHEPTRELAEAAAENEIQVLSSGMAQADQVTSSPTPPPRRSPALLLRGSGFSVRSRSGHR